MAVGGARQRVETIPGNRAKPPHFGHNAVAQGRRQIGVNSRLQSFIGFEEIQAGAIGCDPIGPAAGGGDIIRH